MRQTYADAPFVIDEDVVRLDIAVQQASIVHGSDTATDLH